MPRLHSGGTDDGSGPPKGPGAIPFPRQHAAPPPPPAEQAPADRADGPIGDVSASDVLYAFGVVSRRMEDLARSLGCLGYFDDDDGPRAA